LTTQCENQPRLRLRQILEACPAQRRNTPLAGWIDGWMDGSMDLARDGSPAAVAMGAF
jgi:hypothetical protein